MTPAEQATEETLRRLLRVLAAATYTSAVIAVLGAELVAGVLIAGLGLVLWVAAGTRSVPAALTGTRDFAPPRSDHTGDQVLGPQNRSDGLRPADLGVCVVCGRVIAP